MATSFYGSTVTTSGSYGWRAYGSYTTSNSNTATTVTLTGGFQSLTWNFDINNVACTGYVGSTTSSVSGQSVETSGTESVQLISMSKSITRTTSAQTVTLKVKTVSSSSYYPGTSTASVSITVPALASYTISYNANGGSGAPSSQTKYYGKTLTLSSTKPTRTGYNFLGWSTSSTATTATYSAGGSYTANSAATLYAVWETAIVAPTLSGFTAYRCDSSGAEDDEGEYAYLSVAYSADTNYNSANVVESVVFSCSTASGSVTVSPSAVSGTASGIMSGVDTDLTHTITATATDTNGSTTSATAKVGVVEFILDFSDTGKGVGILSPAPDDGITLGTETIGTVYQPVYLDAGTLTACQLLIQRGGTSATLDSDYSATVSVTFGTEYAETPRVVASVRHDSTGRYHVQLTTRTTTGFSANLWSSSSSSGTPAIDWIAVGVGPAEDDE